MSKLLNKVSISVVSVATVLSLSGAAAVLPVSVHGALTDSQVSAIISLLQSFGADSTTIANVQASLTGGTPATPAAPASSSVPASLLSSGDLTVGSTGAVVKDLQMFLNAAGYTVATSGAGSVGMESTYFGNATKAALAKFQTAMGISPAAGYFGALTRAKLASMGSSTPSTPSTPSVPAGSDMALSLGSMTTGALIQGQAIASLASFTFTNKTSSEAVVKNIVLNRTGVSNDTALANVYLYEGVKRVSDSASVSSGVITFNNPSGIFTVPAMSAKTIVVKADIAGSTNGQIVGVTLASVTSSVSVSGAPVVGPLQSIASATMASVSFNTSTTPTTATIDPQDEYVMWQNTVAISTRAVKMHSISFRQIGSINTSDLKNFKLFVDGVQVGSTLASLDGNGYATFDLSANPVKLETGNRVIKMLGDVVGGSTRTFSFSLRQAGDVMMVDSELNQPILVLANNTTFSARATQDQTVSAGSLSITKKATSLSGNVTKDSTGVSLASFELKASGESMKVENLRVGIDMDAASPLVGSLRNGALFVDGAQVGSTLTIATTTGSTQYTEFNLGSSLVVVPGTPRTLEIRADIYDNDGTNSIVAGSKITAKLVVGSSNVQKMTSLSYDSSSAVDGNELTVAIGGLTASKNAAFGNQTTVVPQTAYKLGSWNLVAGDSEGITLNSISVNLRQDGNTDVVLANMSDIFVKYGSSLTTAKASVSATSTWSINKALAANEILPVEVYATLATGSLSGSTTLPTLYVEGITSSSAQSRNSGYVAGQTVTVQTGSITQSFVGGTGLEERLVVGGTSGNKIASFRFSALHDTYTITDLAVMVGNDTAASAYKELVMKVSGMSDKVLAPFSGRVASTSGLSITVPANDVDGKVIDIYATLNSVGSSAATSSYESIGLTLEGYKYSNSTQSNVEVGTDVTTNPLWIVKSAPVLSSSYTSGTLTNTTLPIAKFTVSADQKGQINWKKVVVGVTKTADVRIGATSTLQLKVSGSNEVVDGTFATTTGALVGGLDAFGALTSGNLIFEVTGNGRAVTAGSSETYELYANITGSEATGTQDIGTRINNLSASHVVGKAYTGNYDTLGDATASFVWSDRSADSTSLTTADWFNDFKVKNLPVTTGYMSRVN